MDKGGKAEDIWFRTIPPAQRLPRQQMIVVADEHALSSGGERSKFTIVGILDRPEWREVEFGRVLPLRPEQRGKALPIKRRDAAQHPFCLPTRRPVPDHPTASLPKRLEQARRGALRLEARSDEDVGVQDQSTLVHPTSV